MNCRMNIHTSSDYPHKAVDRNLQLPVRLSFLPCMLLLHPVLYVCINTSCRVCSGMIFHC